MLAVSRNKPEPPVRVEAIGDSTWRVGSTRFAYVPVVDDHAMQNCMLLALDSPRFTVIVSGNHEVLVRWTLKQALGDRSPQVFSIANFIRWRTSIASQESRLPIDQTMVELVRRYNETVLAKVADRSILVDIPCNPASLVKTTYVQIPTYDPESEDEYDYGRPKAVAVQEVDGLRVVMGDPDDEGAPDVLIERAVDLWRVFVHPNRGDPLCIIEIRKDREQ